MNENVKYRSEKTRKALNELAFQTQLVFLSNRNTENNWVADKVEKTLKWSSIKFS